MIIVTDMVMSVPLKVPVSLGTYSGPKRKQNNASAKFGGTNKECYGIFESGLSDHDWKQARLIRHAHLSF